MEKEPRKATEVLLDLETKVGTLTDLVRAQALDIKVLSNKLSTLMNKLDKQPIASPKITVEAANTVNPFTQLPKADPSKQIPVSADFNLPVEESPTGFRRTSRPETYAGDNAYLTKLPKAPEPKFPVQMPKMPPAPPKAEITVPATALGRTAGQTFPSSSKESSVPVEKPTGHSIPIMQRVVDANGKSIFLADVEIVDLSTMQQIFKNRTNGTGKWMASLPLGAYRVSIHKRESLSKDKLEAVQDIQVDGSQTPLELPLMIIKK